MGVVLDEILKNEECMALVESGAHNKIAEILNEKIYSVPGLLRIDTLLIWLALNNGIKRIETARTSQNEQVASIASVALLLIQNPNIPTIDFGNEVVLGMFNALGTAGIFSNEEIYSLVEQSMVKKSKAEFLIGKSISCDEVSLILGGMYD